MKTIENAVPETTNLKVSVVLAAPARFATIRKTVQHLAAQSIADKIELVLVMPRGCRWEFEEKEVAAFGAVRLVELDDAWLNARARALGAQRSSTRYVLFAEDHCFPEREWAQEMLKALEMGCAAVGPQFHNANPHTTTSWADVLLNFGTCLGVSGSGETGATAWHNTGYRRDVLLGFGERLSSLLEVESALQNELRTNGETLWLQTSARVHHLNISRWNSHVAEQFNAGRLFGATRCSRWTKAHRAIYVLGSPLIPFLRVRTALSQLQNCASLSPQRKRELSRRVLFALFVGAWFHTAGEVIGYCFGVGDAAQRKSDFESHRYRYLCKRERVLETPHG